MRRLKELTPKEQLDRQTSYLTFLPPMEEGFHTGYHTRPGVVTDRSRRPGEWLESLARNMRTSGQDVGYSIPDVLACEQQLRRLTRLDAAEIRTNRQMIEYRAVLAMLLLWDSWEQDENWPVLELSCLSGGNTAFSASVSSALAPSRAPDGLWVFTLRSASDSEGELHPIALLSSAMILIPAANPGNLNAVLPANVRWYDRTSGQFTDPCQSISQKDAFFLISRLRVLQKLKEESQWQSTLLQADEQLVSLLDCFAGDLLNLHAQWRQALLGNQDSAVSALRLRTLAALSQGMLPVEKQVFRPAALPLLQNPLLRALTSGAVPACPSDEMTLYTFGGVPFACSSSKTLFTPAGDPEEEKLLHKLETEISLLQTHDAAWRTHTAASLRAMSAACAHQTGLLPGAAGWLQQWAEELEAIPVSSAFEITLDQPAAECPAALCRLLGSRLLLTDEAIIRSAFSDVLLLWDGEAAYDDDQLAAHCTAEGIGTAVPPLSPDFCRWMMDRFDQEGVEAPVIDPASFAFDVDGAFITASFSLVRRAVGASPACAVTFRRRYRLHQNARFEAGAAVVLPAFQRPGVTVWPNARFAPGLWKSYAVFVQQPGAVSAWVCGSDGWDQGQRYTTPADSWQTVCPDRFPAFVALRRGEVSLGALINDQPCRLLKHEPPAAAAIDFGSTSTTVLLRQGERIQPASLPECMHRTLLKPGRESGLMINAFLPEDVLLPGSTCEATWYSVMDLFTDQPERWNTVLQDGHIYYRSTLEALSQKKASALYYDLKWSEETYARRVMRLFLKQVMLQASLSARLWGSASISWRISMPNAMPLHTQEAYLELMRGLARETAQETGLPLSPDCPSVLFASENQADGLYFLGRSEINGKSGYLNLDIGGSTADLSLWLGGAKQAAIESSLLLGCRQLLFSSLLEHHAHDFEQDFDGMDEALEASIHQVTAVFRQEGSTVRGMRKCMLLLDDLLAVHAEPLRRCMAMSRAEGRISYLESLLLWQIGFLFYLAGEMLERAWHDSFWRMQLPPRMELCIAGNGGQLFKAFSEEQQNRLCSLALARLSADHPLQALLPIQSRHPKQEVARGLLYHDESLHSAIYSAAHFSGSAEDETHSENLLMHYLPLFAHVFPQAAQRLMPRAFQNQEAGAISAAARMELDTIYVNESMRCPADAFAVHAACLISLKRLWNL